MFLIPCISFLNILGTVYRNEVGDGDVPRLPRAIHAMLQILCPQSKKYDFELACFVFCFVDIFVS